MSKNFLSINEQLSMGQFLMSNNKKSKAIFQDDGNFVVYAVSNSPHKAVWATGTNGSDAVRVIMQADGNLVMYNQADQPKWSSGTYIKGTCNKCRVELTDGGKLELTRTVTATVWSS
ncbi:mannose-specific lectin-like isoform X4 [Etheostoma cragini]|uniref:mannose-specific lectin-like isoform X4 n=1 Tax=Etheostoma cragini TaxID=417921 RepID=UPI00155E9096|nr:mannose-specific lectin-like isoform X4 [Etheostoma cragini]